MRSLFLLTAGFLSPLCSAQQSVIPANVERLFTQYIQLADDIAPILNKVKNKAQADQAAPLIQQELARAFELKKEIAKLQQFPPAVLQAVSTKYEKSMRVAWGHVYEEIFRLQKLQCFASLAFAKQLQALCTILNQS